ncbi:dipeptide ABC transporter ATP-binding protein [Nesterenkonia alkaliphila]|uniref:Dipeptide ABC transporter ATP-binding protein n=1 Tax=Nesterenkonia alkaliphila TaxID=1463631 RepID=A0A7K1UK38_9MICC|nr:ABC transporter ATP-binding protein [Nesterenkonia alkaliphila]MVT26840.1 dipeptide ABC transporter ATP-binding protein [Nesterenkonia alkaliphila]GFZ81822.1 ABC transporter ATP-binding protein [Nesterenkonia alkaliphila]
MITSILNAEIDYDELLEDAEAQEFEFTWEPLIILGIAVALVIAYLVASRFIRAKKDLRTSVFELQRAEFDTDKALEFRDVRVSFATEFGSVDAVKGVSFDVGPGEVVAVVGESGSGKSVTSSTAMGLTAENASISGDVFLDGKNVTSMAPGTLRSLRGDEISMVFQEPMTALNPVLKVSDQLTEVLQIHGKAFGTDALAKSIELLRAVGIPDAENRIHEYPHQFSGGQRQRIVIALAVANNPKVIIADEPTTALDVTVQAEILDLLRRLKDESNTAVLLITHNMGVVADMADRVVVMFQGEVVEQGPVKKILREPEHPYTRRLLDAMPELRSETSQEEQREILQKAKSEQESLSAQESEYALQGKDLALAYKFRGKSNRVVEGVNFGVKPGEILGLVGESGSGKSTIAKAVLGLLEVEEGELLIRGKNLPTLPRAEKKALRREIGVVFQDPAASLDPRFPIGDVITEPMLVHKVGTAKERIARAKELLDAVKLPKDVINRYPHELSGGQRQRISIARALSLSPSILIADEPTSALDVSVQARVLEMFAELQEQFEFACLFVTHDLAVVDQLADQIMVLEKGRVVEYGRKDQILRAPQEDYTKRLLAAAPVPDPVAQKQRRDARRELLAAQGLATD